MRVTKPLLLGLALLLDGAAVHAGVNPDDFRRWYEAAVDGRLAIPDGVAAKAGRFRYVFVGGFAGEDFSGYFTRNAKELRAGNTTL